MIRSKFIFFLGFITLLFSACFQQSEGVFLVRYDSIKNLRENSDVYYKGLAVGKVTDLRILPNRKILVEITIDKTIKPTRSDDFALVYSDFIGTQVIEIFTGGTSGDYYTQQDTIVGTITDKERILNPDSITTLDSANRKILYDSLIAPYVREK